MTTSFVNGQRAESLGATSTDDSSNANVNSNHAGSYNNDCSNNISFSFNNSVALSDGNCVRASFKLNPQTGESTAYKLVGTAIINNDINYVPWHFIWRISDFEFIAEEDKLEQRVRGPFQTEWLLQLYPHGHPSQRRKRFNKQDADGRARHTEKFISTYARLTRCIPNRDSIAAKFNCDLLNPKTDTTSATLVSRLTQALYTKSTPAQYFRVNDNSSLASAHLNIPTCINSDKPDSQHYTIVFAMLVEYPQQSSIASYYFLPDKWPHQDYLHRRARQQHFEQIQRSIAKQRDVNIVCSDGGVVNAHAFVLLQLNPNLAQRMWVKTQPAQSTSPPPLQTSTSSTTILPPHAPTAASEIAFNLAEGSSSSSMRLYNHSATALLSSSVAADDFNALYHTTYEIHEPDTPFASVFYCISALYNESQQAFCIDAEQAALQNTIANEDAAMNEGSINDPSSTLAILNGSSGSNTQRHSSSSTNSHSNSSTMAERQPSTTPAATVLSDIDMAEALCFATSYNIEWLAEDIAGTMQKQLKSSNAVKFAHAASIANVQLLFNAAVRVIAENYPYVTNNVESGWLQLPADWRSSMAKLVQEYAEAHQLELFHNNPNANSGSGIGRRRCRHISSSVKVQLQQTNGQSESVAATFPSSSTRAARSSAHSLHSAIPSDNGSVDSSSGGGSSSRGGRRRRKRNA